MLKTINVLPNVNDMAFCGRVVYEPAIKGNVCRFSLIRNFGGGKAPIIIDYVFYKPKNGFPEFLKKGAPIIAHSYVTPQTWTDKDGVKHEELVKVIKSVELATLIQKKIKVSDNPVSEETGEEAITVEE